MKAKTDRYHESILLELINHIPDVVYIKDRKGRLILVNEAHAKGLGLKPDEVAGKTDFDFFPKERAEIMARDDEYVMSTGKPIIDKIERSTRPDGIDNYVSTTKIPRHDEKGNIIGLMGITRDITRRFHLERLQKEKEQIEKRLESLEEMNRMKSEFVSAVSHELRTPLAIIKESVMLILDNVGGILNDKQRDILTTGRNNIERLNKIISELLDISRIERGAFSLHYSLADLCGIINDSSAHFRKLARQKKITLRYNIPAGQINLFIDAERVNQALSNLINNAIKFTEEGGRVSVEVELLQARVRVGVLDTGVGIAEQDIPRLCAKFVQVSRTPASEKKGVGLGLYIVKELVQRHGGEIEIESRLGVGSKFYFTLPLFYSASPLPGQMRENINGLLEKNEQFYLIHLAIVNYGKFLKRIKAPSREFTRKLDAVLGKLQCPVFSHEGPGAEFSIIAPQATEAKISGMHTLLNLEIKRLLESYRLKNFFINIQISTPSDTDSPAVRQISCLHIMSMRLGLEVRKFKRFNYRSSIKIIPYEDRVSAYTVDISEGGLRLAGRSAFDLGMKKQLKIGLKAPGSKEYLYLPVRVAWVRNNMVGVEFTGLRKKEKAVVCRLIRSASTKQVK
ncbi:MAG: ATP-binding protein [Candidatus Omnitrophica bacterium]|nr:ATP-binding protein [Candidatus Omnitrophota bacterium]